MLFFIKGTALIYFDILGNLSDVRHSVNAQGITETYYNVVPAYGMLHIVYKLNREPRKRKM